MLSKIKSVVHKIFHWEYWPFEIVNTPIFFVWCYYAARSKSFFFFNAANPSIKNGGFLMESKKEIYDIIPEKYIPKTLLFTKADNIDFILKSISQKNINYPFIAKPDIGMKGLGVAKINTNKELEGYAQKVPINFLVQEYIAYNNEIGVFYYKYPNQNVGQISGIVYKEMLAIKGNGFSNMETLIKQNPRANFQLKALQLNYGDTLKKVLALQEVFNLVPFGNHSRGAKFIDAKHLITPKLVNKINEICNNIPHFYFGRLDIKYNTIEDLEDGKNFSIIELNGAGSEPTHIYDPKHSLFFAWREISRHLNIQYKISTINNKKGHRYLSFNEGLQMFKANSNLVKQLQAM